MAPTQEDFDRIGNYALMLGEDQNIDRHTCTRVVPLEVLSLGFSRTGTLSMQRALEILGYPNPYHFSSVYGNIRDCDMWLEAFDAKFNPQSHRTFGRAQFDQLLGHCGAVTDSPCQVFAEELVAAYPDARVVLVEREIGAWHASWCKLIDGAFSFPLRVLEWTDPGWSGRIQAMGMRWMGTQLGARSKEDAKANAREVYREHNALVRRVTPRERLLEYKLGSGWEPLCAFLGKPVPDVEFPHLNEAKSIEAVFEQMAKKGMGNSIRNLMTIFGAVGALGLALWIARSRL